MWSLSRISQQCEPRLTYVPTSPTAHLLVSSMRSFKVESKGIAKRYGVSSGPLRKDVAGGGGLPEISNSSQFKEKSEENSNGTPFSETFCNSKWTTPRRDAPSAFVDTSSRARSPLTAADQSPVAMVLVSGEARQRWATMKSRSATMEFTRWTSCVGCRLL